MPTPPIPRFPAALLRTLLPRAERDELLADIERGYRDVAEREGIASAHRWLWRQTLSSVPALLRWSWRRGVDSYEPPANAYRPGGTLMKNWLADLRFAARRLRIRPAYTTLSVLTLALGVGGTAAVFGIARPVVLDPLPYGDEDGIAAFWRSGWWNEEEYTHLRGRIPGFSAVAFQRSGDMTLRVGDAPGRLVPGLAASSELFDVLRARPLLGRTFRPGEDVQGAEPIVVISYGLWQELGGDPSIIGTPLQFDGVPRTVVGVMPKGFWYPTPAIRVWAPKLIDPEGRNGSFTLVGRVQPGQDPAAMAPQVAELTRMLGERFTYSERGDKTKDAWVKPIREELLGSMRPAIVATFAAMGLILLIACVNVAALMLGQVEGRSAELAVRNALGATRARITQQLVIEALLLGVVAAVAGAALAAAGFGVLARSLPIGAWGEGATFDWTLFGVALATAMAAVLLIVAAPAVALWRGDLRVALSGGRTGGIRGRGGRLERGLVVAEVALAMLIATGAAVLVRSVENLYDIDPGVRTSDVAVVDVLSPRDMPWSLRMQKLDELKLALEGIPGVASAAVAMRLPMRGGGDSWYVAREDRDPGPGNRDFTYFRVVSPGYFDVMDIRLRDGRDFTPADTQRSEPVAIINDVLARKLFGEDDPIGRMLVGGFDRPYRVVGVIETVAEAFLTDDPQPAAYYPYRQGWFGHMGSFVVRTSRPDGPQAILDEARRAVGRVAPEFAVRGATTMDNLRDAAVGPARQVMSLLSLLAALALVLGAIGIYGVIAHFAARRRRDWAIRVALGMTARGVVTHVVRHGVLLTVAGVAIGALAAVALTRLLATFLYGVSAIDPLAFVAAGVALLGISVLAAFVPARRAGTTDPALVLREQ